MDAARRASLIDKEARQMRARELFIGESSFRLEDVERSTTKGVDNSMGTTDDGHTTKGACSGKLNPLCC